jgi:hypothetical protein
MRAQEDFSSQVKCALEAERQAWRRLLNSKEGPSSPARLDMLNEWITAHRALREARSQATADILYRAHESLRSCVRSLAASSPVEHLHGPSAHATPAAEALHATPHLGDRFTGRSGSRWRVVGLVNDVIEPDFYLLQIAESERARDEAVHEVYSEDWGLFCVVHGLRIAPAAQAIGQAA